MIPIIIVSYNNHIYVENTVKQIQKINPNYVENIIIMDNNSNDPDTINYLNSNNTSLCIIKNNTNSGPWVRHDCNTNVYNMMPDKFILTDPDLEFNKNLPANFIEIMIELSNKYDCEKIGFALRIDDFNEDMIPGDYMDRPVNIYEWESQFWHNKIENNEYDLYHAAIDTTFCLISKNKWGPQIRIGGDFLARHLPWYIKGDIFNLYDKYLLYSKHERWISTISRLFIPYIDNNYAKVYKKDQLFLIENSNTMIEFWKNSYPSWNEELFNNFHLLASKNKTVIEIGYDIALTSLYLSRISKTVHSINCNNSNSEKTSVIKNIITNNCSNVVIYDSDFGENINYDGLNTLINNNININNDNISFISVNLNGLEEDILQELYNYHKKINIPILINLYLNKWTDKCLSRFSFLQEEGMEMLENYLLILQ
jgi:hypothetical protein